LTLAYRVPMAGVANGGTRARAVAQLAPALAAVAVFVGLMRLADQTAVTVHQCVSVAGLGRLGLGLALLRVDDSCPAGSLAVGGDQRQVLGVVVLVALPSLASHLMAAGAGLGVLARTCHAVRAVLRTLVPTVRAPGGPSRIDVPSIAIDVPRPTPRSRAVVGVPWWRGPPQLRTA
jgi:hypothetical protein